MRKLLLTLTLVSLGLSVGYADKVTPFSAATDVMVATGTVRFWSYDLTPSTTITSSVLFSDTAGPGATAGATIISATVKGATTTTHHEVGGANGYVTFSSGIFQNVTNVVKVTVYTSKSTGKITVTNSGAADIVVVDPATRIKYTILKTNGTKELPEAFAESVAALFADLSI